MSFIEGIFDLTAEQQAQNPEKAKLWKKVSKGDFKEEDVIISGSIGKKRSRETTITDRVFYLTSKSLFYKKSREETKMRGKMDLKWTRAIFCGQEDLLDTDLEQGYFHQIKLMSNKKFTELFFKDGDELAAWRKALSGICLMSDFYSQYSVSQKIGSGSFGEVRFLSFFSFFGDFLIFSLKWSIFEFFGIKDLDKNEIDSLCALILFGSLKYFENILNFFLEKLQKK